MYQLELFVLKIKMKTVDSKIIIKKYLKQV